MPVGGEPDKLKNERLLVEIFIWKKTPNNEISLTDSNRLPYKRIEKTLLTLD